MFRNISAAIAIWATLVLSAGAAGPAAPAAKPQPITTQAAFQSWLAWYHLHPKTPADANGQRFRQLLSAADGDLYFLSGLDDASPQVRELSKQGLIKSQSDRSFAELTARLRSSDAEVRQQAKEILSASCDLCGPMPLFSEPSLFGPAFQGGVPFGGLMRMALSCGQQTIEDFEHANDPEIRDLITAIGNMEGRPGFYNYYLNDPSRGTIVTRLKGLLAHAERRHTSKKSAAKLLELLGQTTQSSALDDVTVEQLKQALSRHIDRTPTAANRGDFDASSESQCWPNYRLRIELEQQVKTPHAAAGDMFRLVRNSCEAPMARWQAAIEPYALVFATVAAGTPHCHPQSVNGDAESDFIAAGWTSYRLSEVSALAPGVYKLLVTFESSPQAPIGYSRAELLPKKVGAIVFRVRGDVQPAIAAVVPINPLSESPSAEPGTWQVLQVALSDSSAPLDDLCVPAVSMVAPPAAPSTFTQPESGRDQLINFSMSNGR